MRALTSLSLLVLVACGADRQPEGGSQAESGPVAPADRDSWWAGATRRESGAERILAPRELRAILAAGRHYGFDRDAAWWDPNAKWAYSRILALDPEDVEANGAVGRKTLQSVPGFAELWKRIGEARVYNAPMEELLEQYGIWVAEERPVFLTEDEYPVVVAKLRAAREHLDRMANDAEYAALQRALERIPSQLRDYPSVQVRSGPFLVFFAAPDLRRIEGEPEASEDERLATLRERYRVQLTEHAAVLASLVEDIGKLYPALAERYPVHSDSFFFLWIFSDPGWYSDFVDEIVPDRPRDRYRCGFFNRKDMWGYAFLPRAPDVSPAADGEAPADSGPDPATQLRETLAYIGAQQLLRSWARDPEDRFSNRLDRSRAYWLKEGWPAFLASRRVPKSALGPALAEGWRFGLVFPPLADVVQRESRLELHRFREADPETVAGSPQPLRNFGLVQHFPDLAWLLVKYLNEDARRGVFEQYLISQIEAAQAGTSDTFAKAFGLKGEADWGALEGAVYDTIEGR